MLDGHRIRNSYFVLVLARRVEGPRFGYDSGAYFAEAGDIKAGCVRFSAVHKFIPSLFFPGNVIGTDAFRG
jgi:hypothetical protein